MGYPQITKYGEDGNVADIEINNLGDVLPHYQKVITGDTSRVLKWYTQDDFTNMKYNLGAQKPNITYWLNSTFNSQ